MTVVLSPSTKGTSPNWILKKFSIAITSNWTHTGREMLGSQRNAWRQTKILPEPDHFALAEWSTVNTNQETGSSVIQNQIGKCWDLAWVVCGIRGYHRLESLILFPNLGKRFEHRPAPGANAWNTLYEVVFTFLVNGYFPISHPKQICAICINKCLGWC